VTPERDYPLTVAKNVAFLREHGVWHIASQNPRVHSCRDAADKRWRLGGRGIPLCDELKSSLGRVDGPDGTRYVAVHCRGHQQLDDDKLAVAVGGRFRRVSEGEILDQFGLRYGTVTPFALAREPRVAQVFDQTVVEEFFPPYTMMTNLGGVTYGVEFYPREVIGALPRTSLFDVVRDEDAVVPRGPTIGILTGNSPESGMLLWEIINQRVRDENDRRFRGDVAFPHVLIESVPLMGLSMELALRERQVRPVVLGAVERLCHNGASVIGIACNTTQYFAPSIAEACRAHGARFVSLVDETADYLHREGITSFDFFGISAVTDFGGFSAFDRFADEFEVHRPDERTVEMINQVAFDVKQSGVAAGPVNKLRDLVNNASVTGAIVVALTELSEVIVTQRRRGAKRIVDTLDILGQRMAEIYLSDRTRASDSAREIEDGARRRSTVTLPAVPPRRRVRQGGAR
jgi:aspartate/glutamate racemase